MSQSEKSGRSASKEEPSRREHTVHVAEQDEVHTDAEDRNTGSQATAGASVAQPVERVGSSTRPRVKIRIPLARLPEGKKIELSLRPKKDIIRKMKKTDCSVHTNKRDGRQGVSVQNQDSPQNVRNNAEISADGILPNSPGSRELAKGKRGRRQAIEKSTEDANAERAKKVAALGALLSSRRRNPHRAAREKPSRAVNTDTDTGTVVQRNPRRVRNARSAAKGRSSRAPCTDAKTEPVVQTSSRRESKPRRAAKEGSFRAQGKVAHVAVGVGTSAVGAGNFSADRKGVVLQVAPKAGLGSDKVGSDMDNEAVANPAHDIQSIGNPDTEKHLMELHVLLSPRKTFEILMLMQRLFKNEIDANCFRKIIKIRVCDGEYPFGRRDMAHLNRLVAPTSRTTAFLKFLAEALRRGDSKSSYFTLLDWMKAGRGHVGTTEEEKVLNGAVVSVPMFDLTRQTGEKMTPGAGRRSGGRSSRQPLPPQGDEPFVLNDIELRGVAKALMKFTQMHDSSLDRTMNPAKGDRPIRLEEFGVDDRDLVFFLTSGGKRSVDFIKRLKIDPEDYASSSVEKLEKRFHKLMDKTSKGAIHTFRTNGIDPLHRSAYNICSFFHIYDLTSIKRDSFLNEIGLLPNTNVTGKRSHSAQVVSNTVCVTLLFRMTSILTEVQNFIAENSSELDGVFPAWQKFLEVLFSMPVEQGTEATKGGMDKEKGKNMVNMLHGDVNVYLLIRYFHAFFERLPGVRPNGSLEFKSEGGEAINQAAAQSTGRCLKQRNDEDENESQKRQRWFRMFGETLSSSPPRSRKGMDIDVLKYRFGNDGYRFFILPEIYRRLIGLINHVFKIGSNSRKLVDAFVSQNGQTATGGNIRFECEYVPEIDRTFNELPEWEQQVVLVEKHMPKVTSGEDTFRIVIKRILTDEGSMDEEWDAGAEIVNDGADNSIGVAKKRDDMRENADIGNGGQSGAKKRKGFGKSMKSAMQKQPKDG